ncbi:lysoplasmalogenase [Streptomyces albidus (ex Kaewkla and Franco 2022)]|uniref:lysoplasmalogenase n=1 Tax=Streptomyces albidus (ex Kaewkla and Franco 2022) TaxID=722709 RepID=UPI0015EF69EA|nr:lysoplasmalogenase [Streptomyces albidus (ex Kaewkla and Franco 2022)]
MTITGRSPRHTFLSAAKAAAARLTRPDGHGRGALVAFGALAAADLAAVRDGRARGLRRAAKPLLMPALASYALRRRPDTRTPAPGALVTGLAFATAGDSALLFDEHEPAFLLGMAAFLGTQVSYTAGYARLGALRSIRRKPWPAVGCLAGWAAVNAVLAPSLEKNLRLPVAGYSLALTVMGATALGVGGRVGAGAAAFLGSDLLIGLQAAGRKVPSQELLIMAGYIFGQYLITTGWLDRSQAGAPAPETA